MKMKKKKIKKIRKKTKKYLNKNLEDFLTMKMKNKTLVIFNKKDIIFLLISFYVI